MADTIGLLGGIEKAKLQFTLTASGDESPLGGLINSAVILAVDPSAALSESSTPADPTQPAQGVAELIVQFNPSTLRLESSANKVPVRGLLDHLSDIPNAQRRNASIVLNVELIFDAVNNANAFHQDSLQMTTPSGIANQVADVANSAKGEDTKYSVMKQTNLIIGMLTLAPIVKFSWGTQEFEGIMESVRARYEMFSPQGFPIRSRVEMRIEQLVNADQKKGDFWAGKFNTFFENDATLKKHGKSALQNQSVLNLNGY
jgi:hypothetical protein